MNEKINELYNKLDAQDEIIEQLELENASLKKDKKKAIEYCKENIKQWENVPYFKEILEEDRYILEILGDKE